MISTQAAIKDPRMKCGSWICGKEIAREYLACNCVYIEYKNYRCLVCGYTIDHLRWGVDDELVDRHCPICGALNVKL